MKRGFPYGLRLTVTHDQMDRLADSIRYICTYFDPTRIQVEPAYQLGRWESAPSAETMDFIHAYREAKAEAEQLGREISFSAARLGTLSNHFCGITQDSFCVTTEGDVSACYEVFSADQSQADVFVFGREKDGEKGYEIDVDKLDAMRRETVQFKGHCNDCFAKVELWRGLSPPRTGSQRWK